MNKPILSDYQTAREQAAPHRPSGLGDSTISQRDQFLMLKRRAAAAAHWRKDEPAMADRGWVLFYRGQVAGWTLDLDDPAKWCPGCIALGIHGLDGPVYQATGGNDQAGATEWSLIRHFLDADLDPLLQRF